MDNFWVDADRGTTGSLGAADYLWDVEGPEMAGNTVHRVAWFADPDGNVLSFSQPAAAS